MARYQPLWQQSGTYQATRDRQLMGALWPGGACTGGVSSAVAATMQVSVAAGVAAVPLQSGQGSALCSWDAAEVTTLANATHTAAQTRIDLIIVQYRDNALDAGGNNDFIVTNVTGTPATTGSQVAPATPANALVIAQVSVVGGIANLNAAPFVDYRQTGLAIPSSLHASAWRNAAFNATTTNTDFAMDMETWDTANIFTPGSALWTLPVAGFWRLHAQVAVTATASGQWLSVYWILNSNASIAIVSGAHASSGNVFRCDAAVTVKAAAGDQYRIQIGASVTLAGISGAGGQWNTLTNVDYLGP
jgi:hypothetical protein